MCILLIQIPSDTKPLIVANNRDEFLRRPTSRGSLVSGVYSPIDKQSGGSWIAYDTISSRYAVILNFHLWRYERSVDISAPDHTINSSATSNSNIASSSSSQYKSRGLLVNDFINSQLSVEVYKDLFLQANNDFKGFHFLFGDAHTCYILTKAYENEPVTVNKLTLGEIYGVSNGHVYDKNWRKVEIGLKHMRTIVSQYTNDNNTSSDDNHTAISASEWEQLAYTLLNDLLRDSTLLPDATMTRLNLPSTLEAQQLAAIFVIPTALSPSVFPLPPPSAVPLSLPLLHLHSNNISTATITGHDPSVFNSISDTVVEAEEEDTSQVVSTLKRASAYLDTIVNTYTPNKYLDTFNATFATRTSTVIIAYISCSYNPPQINDSSDGRNPFFILENDFDPVSGEWSIQCIHNV